MTLEKEPPMTLRELKDFLATLNESQLDTVATVHATYTNEYIAIHSAYEMENLDVILELKA